MHRGADKRGKTAILEGGLKYLWLDPALRGKKRAEWNR